MIPPDAGSDSNPPPMTSTLRPEPTDADTADRAIAALHPRLELRGVSKRYGGVHALRGADLSVSGGGIVHGLIGANGSGKSTLLGVLSGQVTPDDGSILLDGEEVHLGSPLRALQHGIAMVSQETALAPELSIAENVFLGHRLVRRPVTGIDWPSTFGRAQEFLRHLGIDEDPALAVKHLRPDRQQMVEIARALSLDARILVLDEPTSSLSDGEVEQLFDAVRRLRQSGTSTIFVSHRLSELTELCDELTVLRDGLTVDSGVVTDFDVDRIVESMVGDAGRWRQRTRADRTHRPEPGAAPALAVRGLRTVGGIDDVDLHVESGEVVGLAGIVGAGRSELLEAIFGVLPATGRIELAGRAVRFRSIRDAIDAGLGYLPPDRKLQGVVLSMAVEDNLAAVATRDVGRLRRPGGRWSRELVADAITRLAIKTPSTTALVGTLSGGNQQKVALGRWIVAGSQVLLLDQPTRGVDVATKVEIHALLRELAADGAAILVSSSDTDELLDLCDRIVVMYRGTVAASLPIDEVSDEVLARYAGGHT